MYTFAVDIPQDTLPGRAVLQRQHRYFANRISGVIASYAISLGYPEYAPLYQAQMEKTDGPAYWNTFETTEDIKTDFRMWLENIT